MLRVFKELLSQVLGLASFDIKFRKFEICLVICDNCLQSMILDLNIRIIEIEKYLLNTPLLIFHHRLLPLFFEKVDKILFLVLCHCIHLLHNHEEDLLDCLDVSVLVEDGLDDARVEDGTYLFAKVTHQIVHLI